MTAPKSFFRLPEWIFPVGAILLMFWAMADCALAKDDAPAHLSKQSENLPPVTECQLLLSDAEAAEQGFVRQRRMYPASSRQRLSEQAVREGFNAATQKEAMACFNRAWRFNPENPMAYWGAGIVRGGEAMRYGEKNNLDIARKCWDDCLKLFEMGAQLLNHVSSVRKVEFQMDQAQSYISYADTMKDHLDDHGKALLEKAEAIVLQYYNCTLFKPEENRRVKTRAAWQLWKIYAALGKNEEAEKYNKEAEGFLREYLRETDGK